MKALIFSIVLFQIASGIFCQQTVSIGNEVTELAKESLNKLRGIQGSISGCVNGLGFYIADAIAYFLEGLQNLGLLSVSKLTKLTNWLPIIGDPITRVSNKILRCTGKNNKYITRTVVSKTTDCILKPFNEISENIDTILEALTTQLIQIQVAARNISKSDGDTLESLGNLAKVEIVQFLKIVESIVAIPTHLAGAVTSIPTCIGLHVVGGNLQGIGSEALSIGACIAVKQSIARID